MALSRFPRTRVKWHHKALTAWFADATPAMIWRWNREELPEGFTLRSEQGQTHLMQKQTNGSESSIAVFPSPATAERALDMLSRKLLGHSSFWQKLIAIFAVLGLFMAVALIYGQFHPNVPQPVAGGPTGPVTPPAQARPGQPASQPPAPPAQPAKAPVVPVPGQPVDVDQLYK